MKPSFPLLVAIGSPAVSIVMNSSICFKVLYSHYIGLLVYLGEKSGMKSDEASSKAAVPHLVKFNRAFKLAEQWVNNMSKLDGDGKSVNVKVESRPPRLGVGAAVPRESKVVRSNDPVERRLRAKLETDKMKVVKNAEAPAEPTPDGSSHEDSDDEELESKTKAFAKKRPSDWTSTLLQAKKKPK